MSELSVALADDTVSDDGVDVAGIGIEDNRCRRVTHWCHVDVACADQKADPHVCPLSGRRLGGRAPGHEHHRWWPTRGCPRWSSAGGRGTVGGARVGRCRIRERFESANRISRDHVRALGWRRYRFFRPARPPGSAQRARAAKSHAHLQFGFRRYRQGGAVAHHEPGVRGHWRLQPCTRSRSLSSAPAAARRST